MNSSKLALNLENYNNLVKDAYKINEIGMEYLLYNELDFDACIAYHEISSNQTISGHAEIFEPRL